LRGAFERKNGERVRTPGALESFELSIEDAEALILNARVAAGWIEADPQPEPEPEAEGHATSVQEAEEV
jgi:N utilization substance protein A